MGGGGGEGWGDGLAATEMGATLISAVLEAGTEGALWSSMQQLQQPRTVLWQDSTSLHPSLLLSIHPSTRPLLSFGPMPAQVSGSARAELGGTHGWAALRWQRGTVLGNV